MTVEPPIILCDQWGARPPRSAPAAAGRPSRVIFHATAGHAHNESREALFAYARAIQADHMSRQPVAYNDSGHNFLIGRNGLILEGRRGTVARLRQGLMVVSAHCPGQNDQPGIEHEQVGAEGLTGPQRASSVALQAWIFDRCKGRPTEIFPHSQFFGTECPTDTLRALIPGIRLDVARAMTRVDPAKRRAVLRAWILARVREGWSWQRIKLSANWREYRRLGGT